MFLPLVNMLQSFITSLLRWFGRRIVKRYHPVVVGITGSVGKTTTKEAVAAVLGKKFRVKSSVKNFNNEIGVPLTIIGIDRYPGRSVVRWFLVFVRAVRLLMVKDSSYPDTLVLEMGCDKPGDMHYLVEIAPCTVGVITAISHAHTEFFKTLKRIAQEKRVIISHLDQSGFAVLNFDSDIVMEQQHVTKAAVVTFGFKNGADVQATDAKILYDDTGWPTGLNFKVTYGGSTVPVFLNGAIAEHLVSAALAGLAVGVSLGVNLVEGAEGLRTLSPIPGRMRLLPGIKNSLLIDDTYNSSPEAAKAALRTLAETPLTEGGERYAVLGDMLELGSETEGAHREVGFLIGELGIDFLITVGEASKGLAAAAREAGLDEHHVASFADSVSAGKFLQEKIKAGDVILVKGSQGMRMEKIVKEVMAEPLRAAELLVRQNDSWVTH